MTKKYKIVVSETRRDWNLPFQQQRMRLVKFLDKLIHALNNNPKNIILDGQTVILEDYLEIRPEMERELKRLIQNGKISVGPWYALPDEFLVSPESLIRNLMIGHIIAESFGKVMKVGYVPNSFGHISQLPQILRGFGIDSVIFQYGSGNEAESLGPEFIWYAPDDRTNVLAVHQAHPDNSILECIEYANESLDDAELIHGDFDDYFKLVRLEKLKKYKGELRGSRYKPIFPGVFSSRIYLKQSNEAAQTLIERWAEPFSAFSWTETGNEYPKAFLWYAWKNLIKNHAHDDICGCSIDEVHQDDMIRYKWVQQVGEKITSEALESIVQSIDINGFVVFNPLAWQRIDPACIEIPMSSIPENPVVKSASGEIVPSQIIEKDDGIAEVVFQGLNPALGYAAYYMDSAEASYKGHSNSIKVSPRMIENKFYRININTNGNLDILDKSTGNEYKGCNLYEDTEDAGDEYDYSPIKRSKTITNRGSKATVRVVENGQVKTTVEIKLSLTLPRGLTKDRESRTAAKLSCPIITRVTIYANNPGIDFVTTFENKVEDHRLRVVFPTDIKTSVIHVEGHFDVLTRSLDIPKPKSEWAQDPIPTNHQNAFIDIDNGERGFAVISKGLPEYEVRKAKDGCFIYLTLLRCVGWSSRNDLLTRRFVSKNPKATPEAQCPGTHTFLYSVFPHKGDWLSAQVQRRAHEHNVPMRAIPRFLPLGEDSPNTPNPSLGEDSPNTPNPSLGEDSSNATDSPLGKGSPNFPNPSSSKPSLPSLQSFISLEPPSLMMTALKKCELGDGLILRFYNSTPETVNGVIKAHRFIKSARLTNLNEEPLVGNIDVSEDGSVSLVVDGHEIKSVELIFERGSQK